jgi:hypothetical protein
VEFNVHKNASLLVLGVMLFQNITRKNDQPIMYAYKLLNKVKQIIAQQNERLQQFLLCTILDIICWAISLSFM